MSSPPHRPSTLVASRALVNQQTRGLARRHLTPGFRAQYDATILVLEDFVQGDVIDLGAGDSPFRETIGARAQRYDTLDTTQAKQDVTYVGDIQHMPGVPSGCYDVALCFQVLEHVPEPLSALRECYRILRPGGRLVLSVPHLSRLHDLPHDYYRYTHQGVAHLSEKAGFAVERIDAYGGIPSFVGHQLSTLLLTLTQPIPVLRVVIRLVNRALLVWPCFLLDRIVSLGDIAPLGYVAVLQKPPQQIAAEARQ